MTTTEHDVFCDCHPCLLTLAAHLAELNVGPTPALDLFDDDQPPSLETTVHGGHMTTTPTVELTMADRHRIAADLYAWNGFGDKIVALAVDYRDPVRVQVYAGGTGAGTGRTLQVARDMLDDPAVTVINLEDGATTASLHVHVTGTYRGVPILVVDVLLDQADRDLIRDLPADRVLDALAGDNSREG